ncbi:MAG: hypothetical protein WD749_11645 [Phycisphaerales bacterium]
MTPQNAAERGARAGSAADRAHKKGMITGLVIGLVGGGIVGGIIGNMAAEGEPGGATITGRVRGERLMGTNEGGSPPAPQR